MLKKIQQIIFYFLFILLLCGQIFAAVNYYTYSTPGTYEFNFPSNAYNIYLTNILLVGAGGGGGQMGSGVFNDAGGGGGGGGWGNSWNPGSIAMSRSWHGWVQVGSGGSPGSGGGASGTNGGASYFYVHDSGNNVMYNWYYLGGYGGGGGGGVGGAGGSGYNAGATGGGVIYGGGYYGAGGAGYGGYGNGGNGGGQNNSAQPQSGASGIAQIQITYDEDNTDPYISSYSISPSSWTNGSVGVSFQGADAHSGVAAMYYNLDGAGWVGGNSFTITTAGTHSFYFLTYDVVGRSVQNGPYYAYIDKTTPGVSGTPTDTGIYSNINSIVFNWTTATDTGGSEVASYYCQIGTTPGGNNVFDGNVGNVLTKTITGSSGNTYYCRVYTIDGAGNSSAWSGNSNGILLDTALPAAPAINPNTTSWAKDVNFTLDTNSGDTDGSGVQKRQYKIDSGSWTDYSGQVTIQTDGQHTIYSRAIDNAGNTGQETSAVVYRDTTPPSDPTQGTQKYTRNEMPTPSNVPVAGGNDAGSGIAGYDIYWGKLVNGTTVLTTITGSLSNYTPPACTEGNGKYYLRARSKDNAGNVSDWQTIYVYDFNPADYTFYNTINSSTNIAALDTVRYERKIQGEVVGFVSINVPDLGLNFYSDDFSTIVIAKDTNNNPYISVPAGSDLANAVNGNNKWVPIKLGPFTKAPVIKYSTNGSTWEPIVDYEGNPTSTNIRNYLFANNYVSFEVNHFSMYGTAVLNSIYFTDENIVTDNINSDQIITVDVKDNGGEGIENAPVTFSIQGGSGKLNGGSGPVVIRTNAAGVATVNYTFPNQRGTNIVQAAIESLFDTIIMRIPGGMSPEELAQYTAWAAGYSGIGDQNDDPDHDGVKNVNEWNYGVDPTLPNDPDSDNDGLNDKWDAYPNNISQKVFNAEFDPNTPNAETFTGAAHNAAILAPSTNLVVNYSSGSRVSVSDNINDDSHNVLKISGLAKEAIRDGNLAFASTTYDLAKDLYRGLKPGETYAVQMNYINRGNAADSYGVTVNMTQASNRWSVSYSNSGLNNVQAWQLASLEVNSLPNNALAYEKVTLNIEVGYDTGSAVSYNSFANAYIGNTYNNEGYYGGSASFVYDFLLEAEGFNLSFVRKIVTANAPAGYNGLTVSETNLVPGAKLVYSIVFKNNNYAVATSVNLTDKIPNNCHLYYTEMPMLDGAIAWAWKGAVNNTADKNTVDAIKFEVTIPARGTVTASYTVTVD